MIQPSKVFLIKFGFVIILLKCYAATTLEKGSIFDFNIDSKFSTSLVPSSSYIKNYPSFAPPFLQSSIIGSSSTDARKTIASNTEASKSYLGPTISTPTNNFLLLVANNLSRSASTDSIKTSSTLESAIFASDVKSSTSEDITSTPAKSCSKLPLSRNLNAVPSASILQFLPNKETKSLLLLNPYKETKLNSFAQAALSAPALQKFLNYKISGSDASVIFFNHTYNTLRYFGAPNYVSNANEISKAVATINVLTLPLYFQATGNTIKTFLLLKGIEMLSILPQNYARNIEDSVLSSNIDGPVSLYQALLNGFSNFISSLGFCDGKEADNLSFIFSSELISL